MTRSRRRRWRSLAWLLGIAVVGALLAVLAFVPLARAPSGETGPLIGKTAPSLEARDLDGAIWTMADGRNRITWVNLWATSCEPCRTEMPAMQRLAEAYGGELLILGLDRGESHASVADFAARYGITYPILLDPTLANSYRWSLDPGLPRHWFVDAEGTVVREVVGPLAPGRMVEILEELIGPAPA
ncbi:MAG TPA: TlpA disulfide reductase family protein [Candidatus Limnocylindria bacterium]|nr:TlpA disulfide reductase family protein [Candidatus Limnocylindria bacterium]